MRILILVSWLLGGALSLTANAGEEHAQRFVRQIDPIAAILKAQQPDALAEGDARDQLFKLESLLKLYRRAFSSVKGLNEARDAVKEMEDAIGGYSFQLESLQFAESRFADANKASPPDAGKLSEQEKVLEALRRKRDKGREEFLQKLASNQAASLLGPLRDGIIARTASWDDDQDLRYVLGELGRYIAVGLSSDHDFKLLEDGVHEYRRQIRWLPMMIDALDGLVMVRDDSCPLPELSKLKGSAYAKHRYANPKLAFPAAKPCVISRCILWQLSKSVKDLGNLKDAAQGSDAVDAALKTDTDTSRDNTIAAEETLRAEAIRQELQTSGALEALREQFGSCLK